VKPSACSPATVAHLFLKACLAELDAIKPGNVHRGAEGHGMTVLDFERSAEAAAPAIARAGLGVGGRILAAVEASWAAVPKNTNLGILLLCAPLAEAALAMEAGGSIEAGTKRVLKGLSLEDARLAYRAIRLANPGGLGRSKQGDVRDEPESTLQEAMRQAQERDRIAWNYAHSLADLFTIGAPRLRLLLEHGWPLPWAVTGTYLAFLGKLPDSHIRRKYDDATAEAVRLEAGTLDEALLEAADPESLAASLRQFDASLKSRGLNPGTSADLTVASLFLLLLSTESMVGIAECRTKRV
jgi:triphosphoribosyl-dephospho-CoA synthase